VASDDVHFDAVISYAKIRRGVDRVVDSLDPALSPLEQACVLLGVVEGLVDLHPTERKFIAERLACASSRVSAGEGGN
jgi:hypothetical protein